jgi:predicted permease
MHPENWVRIALLRLRSLFRRRQVDDDLDEEIRFHVERKIESYLSEGMSPEEARRFALREFGGIEQSKESCRDARKVNWIRDVGLDLRYAARLLRKSPALTAVVVITLGLGIGANTAVFSIVYPVLVAPLPYPQSDRLVMVWEEVHLPSYQNDQNTPSPGNFADWSRDNRCFEDVAAMRDRAFNLSGDGEPVRVEGEAVSANLFSVLGVRPSLGRVFTPEEDQPGNEREAIIGYGLWQSRFGSNPQAIGQTFLINGDPFKLVGVMPPGYHFSDPDDQLWVPLALSQADLANHGSHYLRIVARLKSGVTLDQARSEMKSLAARITEAYPQTNTGQTVNLIPLREQLAAGARPVLLLVFAAVAFVLLIACANVANLILARASARHREIAVRRALGAGRGRILRQLLTESILLAQLGGLLGLALAYLGVAAFKLFGSAAGIPRLDEVKANGAVLAFSFIVSALAGVVSGVAPAWQASRGVLREALREGAAESAARSRLRARNLLILVETALGMIVLAGAGLLFRSFVALERVPLGFEPGGVLSFRAIPRGQQYAEPVRQTQFYQQALDRIVALPGVRSAGAITFIPLTQARGSKGFSIEGRAPAAGELPMADYEVASPDYFRTMSVPIVQGRDFSWNDTPQNRSVIIINQAMARTFWPGDDPVGARIKQGRPDQPLPWLTIAGVAGDVREYDVETPPRPAMYFPVSQFQEASGVLRDWVVRTSGDPLALAPAVREAIWSLDKDLPISRVQTMEQVHSVNIAPQRFRLLVIGLFALLSLMLATAGLYGVTSYSVALRSREIGIRMALGARPRDVLARTMAQGLLPVILGIVIGIFAGLAVTRLISALLYGVSAADPAAYAGAAALLATVALIACYVSARRAISLDPMLALRRE